MFVLNIEFDIQLCKILQQFNIELWTLRRIEPVIVHL